MILPGLKAELTNGEIMILEEEFLTPQQRNPEEFEYDVIKADLNFDIEISTIKSGISEIMFILKKSTLYLNEKEVDIDGRTINENTKEIPLDNYHVKFVKTSQHEQFIPIYLDVNFRTLQVEINY